MQFFLPADQILWLCGSDLVKVTRDLLQDTKKHGHVYLATLYNTLQNSRVNE